MGYGLIGIVAAVALALWFVFATDASLVSKVSVSVVLVISLLCVFHFRRFSALGFILLICLGVFIAFYRIYLQSSSGGKD